MVELGPELLDPEAAPAAEEVTMRVIPNVGKMAIIAVALGMILSAEAIIRGFFSDVNSTVGWIPFAGKVITAPIHKIEQKLISFLSGIEQDVDQALGHATHNMAVLINQLWHTLEETAWFAIRWPDYLDQALYSLAVKPFIRYIRKLISPVLHRLNALDHTVTHTVRIITHTVTRVIVKSAKVATVAVPKYVHRELRTLRHEVRQLQKAEVTVKKEISQLYRKVSLSSLAPLIAAAVATAIPDVIKCAEVAGGFGKRGCNFWRDLMKLLDVLGAVFLFEHFCDLWAKAEPLFAFVLAPVVGVISTFADGACSHRPSSWETIGVQLHLPTKQDITATLKIG